MGIGAAIAGGISAVGAVAGSMMSASAAKSAAKTQADAANAATVAAQQQNAQTRADLMPYNTSGQGAQTTIDSLASGDPSAWAKYGMSGPTFQPTQAQLEATPGYQFDLSQGLNSVNSSNAAKGLGVSGAALKGAANFATGLANNTLQTQAGIFQNNYNNVMNPLTATANRGEAAAATTGQVGSTNTANANNALMAGANATAAGTVGSANAISGGLTGIGNSATNYLLMNNLLGDGAGSNAADTAALGAGSFA